MAKTFATSSFQYKIVKSIVLSILIPATIILFSAWFFFGEITIKPTASTAATINAANKTDSCKGMTQDKCKPDACVWDPKQNMCLGAK